jgi:hypothetical protein
VGNRTKLARTFGVTDVPLKVVHNLRARLEHEEIWSTQADKRSWKRRRKSRWRPNGGSGQRFGRPSRAFLGPVS